MQKVVCHLTKAKGGSSGGLTHHIDRTNSKEQDNVYESKSHLNFELVKTKGSIDDMIRARLEEGYKGKKAIRKDAVTSCRYILSGSHEQMKLIGENPQYIREWALDNFNYFKEMYGDERNIVRASVHLDEKTPHMHLIVIPLTPDGRLSAKYFTGTKKQLKDLQTDYAAKVGAKWGFERGVENSPRKHIESKDFYKYLNTKDLDSEWVLNHPERKDIISKIMQDNDLIRGVQRKRIEELENTRTKQLNNQKIPNNGIERRISKQAGRAGQGKDQGKGDDFGLER